MSTPGTPSALHSPLFLASAALNIFLVAFIFGRLTGQPELPPPPFMSGPGAMADHGPPPPFLGPDDLFTQKERDENFAALKPEFDKARDLRESFAAALKKGPVSRKDVIAHFTQMDDLMDHVKSIMKEKIADKIAKLDEKGRVDFAEHMLKRHEGEGGPNGGPGFPPGHEHGHEGHGPDDHGPDDHGPDNHGVDPGDVSADKPQAGDKK